MPLPTTYDDLLAAVRDLEVGDRPAVVAIAGHGGAGKSTLAERLARDLGDAAVVPTDRFYAVGAGPASGLWDLHDWPALLDLLRRVRGGAERLRYHVRAYGGAERDVDEPMPRVVLVEGIRLLHERVAPLVDLAVWIDLAPEAAAERAKTRNAGQGDSPAELALWDTKWLPEGVAYEDEVHPAGLADLVIPAAGVGHSPDG